MKAGNDHIWTILFENQPIGSIGIKANQNEGGKDRGFWLSEQFWGRGIMSEAVSAVNDFTFDVLRIKKITLKNFIDNVGSHRVKEKTGATLLHSEKQKWRGKYREMEIWELTAENWRKFKEENS
ncbi:MAG: GNAT family protein [Pseudomonadota bacterium]